jgi:hypothetical protein
MRGLKAAASVQRADLGRGRGREEVGVENLDEDVKNMKSI